MLANVQRYTRDYQQDVLTFIQTQRRVQQHLDWRPMRDWLNDDDACIFLSVAGHGLRGLLAFSKPVEGTTWLRLIGIHNQADTNIFAELLSVARIQLDEVGVKRILVLDMQPWLAPILVVNAFERIHHLVHLRRPAGRIDSKPTIKIMRANYRHIPLVVPIDHAAFDGAWQMDTSDFTSAMSYASHFTLALQDQQPVGYQLSTSYSDGIHLARLAVLPEMMGQHIGSQLVIELINKFPRHSITVNTQSTNEPAQRLYQRLGFEKEDTITPIWRLQ
ncbi:MAG: GNAT family N-acetyltransferase [Chloroflexi bacterium]|nr:GNAT family N-acetyltransferase [Chloroflexota bacterium]